MTPAAGGEAGLVNLSTVLAHASGELMRGRKRPPTEGAVRSRTCRPGSVQVLSHFGLGLSGNRLLKRSYHLLIFR